MNESVERLFSGLFECGECGIHYRVTDADETALFCLECGADLDPLVNAAEEESDVVGINEFRDRKGPGDEK